MTLEPTRMLRGPNVLRIVWVPGTDRLRGVCHCGAAYEAEDPAAVWDWLLAHPVGHDGPSEADPPSMPSVGDVATQRDRVAVNA